VCGVLGAEFASSRASLAIVYGRRRVGKSNLIREAIKDRPHIFYQATRVTSSLNLEAFKAEIARALGADELLTGIVHCWPCCITSRAPPNTVMV
jgi:uncharacterized protein